MKVWADANPKTVAIVTEDEIITAPIVTSVTSNEAEYRAVLAAVTTIPGTLEIFSDSQLVINQLNREWKIKKPGLKVLADLVWKNMVPGTTFTWIPREENRVGKILG